MDKAHYISYPSYLIKNTAGLFLYYIITVFLKAGVHVSGLFSVRIRHLLAGQRGVFDKLRQFAARRDTAVPCFWFHCASLGEFEQGPPAH